MIQKSGFVSFTSDNVQYQPARVRMQIGAVGIRAVIGALGRFDVSDKTSNLKIVILPEPAKTLVHVGGSS